MEKIVWTLLVAVTVCVTWTSAESAVWKRKKNGLLHVSVADIPGVHNVTVTVQGDKGGQSVVFIPHVSADKTWKTVVPDFEKDDVIRYVIQFQLTDTLHRVTGYHSFIREETSFPLGSERYLQRRATTVFFDDFSHGFDSTKWQKDNMAVGLGFEIRSPENVYVKNGELWIKPTLTVDRLGPNIMEHGVVDVKYMWGYCWDGNTCLTRDHENRPVISGNVRSKPHGHIKYGKVEVVAKMPKGKWLWPAIWMMPTENHYGAWPRSGEIDLIETAGNLDLLDKQNHQMGLRVSQCHIHYGPNSVYPAHVQPGDKVVLPQGTTYGDGYHRYWLDWTESYLKLGVDDHVCMTLNTPNEGFWTNSHQHGQNIWASGGKNAPFDRPFYMILTVSVGKTFFWNVPANRLPWTYGAADDYRQFWQNRDQWLPSWHGDDVAMKVRSVKLQQY